MDNLSGQIVRGYELRELAGAGGFGAVYRAYQSTVGREVAIKVILPQYANQPEFIRRFDAEAQLVARLEHPHIVPLYDYWREPDGAYLVMRWLSGGNLRETLQDHAFESDSALSILDQIAGALAVAHRNQVVHRDLKPDNILLDPDGNAYLSDFGIAKDIGRQDSGEGEEEGMSGSPAYISPEQITSEATTPQTDVYALGIILYELLTGLHPFRDSTVSQLIYNHLRDPLPYVPTLSDEINDIIQKSTAKKPEDRYADVLEVPAAFRRAISQFAPDSFDLLPDLDLFSPVNPYKGLRAFEEADAANFFGREKLTAQLVARLGETQNLARFLAVVGPSGSGKSSAVKAGLLPALKQGELPGSENWFVVEMVPGNQPILALNEALLSVAMKPPANMFEKLSSDTRSLLLLTDTILQGIGGELVLLIDQFEEVFTHVEDEADRVHFLELLRVAITEESTRLRVIITLRADFYDKPLLYDGFGELIQARTHVVLPLSADEIERAVVGPAERVGLQVDANLLATIVADVQEEPGALPLLQYALTEVFERRQGYFLTLEAYQNIGGVSGALARRAEGLYSDMDSVQQTLIRQILLRLVTLGEGSEDTRRRVGWTELSSVAGDNNLLQEVLDRFGKYRLFSFDRDPQTRTPTVELAHESLLRQWDRLRELLDESRADLRQERLLAAAVNEWKTANQDSSFLLRGNRLAQIREWVANIDIVLTQEERDFVEASVSEHERQEAAEAERDAHEAELERRARNRLRTLVMVMAVAVVVALGLTALAFNQSMIAQYNAATATLAQGQALFEADNAQTQAALAEIARTTSDANAALASTNEAIANTQVAIADRNAEEAESLVEASGAQQALLASNTDLAVALALEANHISNPPFQAQQALIAAGFAPGTRRLFAGHSDRVLDAAFSTDGSQILSISADGAAILWDIKTGQIVQRANLVTPSSVNTLGASLSLSPDNQRAIFTFSDGTLIHWDVANWEEIRRETLSIGLWRAAFAPDGYHALLSFQLNSGNLFLVDMDQWQVIAQFSGHNEGVPAIAFSPDGKTALSGSTDDTLILWDIETGQEIRRFTGHTGVVTDLAFNTDGTQAFSGAADGGAILWDVQSGEAIMHFQYLGGGVDSVAIAPDGRSAVAGFTGGGLVQWELQTGAELQHYVGHTTDIMSVSFNGDGTMLISASADSTLRLWDVNGGAELRRFQLDEAARSVAINPDGKLMLSGTGQGALAVWNLESGEIIRELERQGDSVLSIKFTDDGQRAITASYDGTVVIWDVATGEALHSFHQEGGTASSFVFRPDRNSILVSMFSTVNFDFTTDLISLDLESGQEMGRLSYPGAISSIALSPDGQQVLVGVLSGPGNPAGELALLDAQTGELIRHFAYPNTAPVYAVDLSPDGKMAISGSGDANVILWDVATGEEIRRFIGHNNEVHSVAFSPDGKTVLSGSQDSSLILWDVETGQELLRYRGHSDRTRGIFSPDGKMVVSASTDGSIRFWRVPPALDEMIVWTRANRYLIELSCDQRRLYRVEPLCGEIERTETATP